MSEAEEMELFKKEFYEDLSKITNHRTVSNAAVNISEEAFKAMKDDPQYREKVLSLIQRDWGDSYAPRNCSVLITVGATLNEYRADSWPVGYDSEFDMRSQNSFYKRTSEKKDRQKELLEEYLENRAQAKKQQLEMLNKKIAKMELERSRQTQSWNSERQMAKASNAYDANIMMEAELVKNITKTMEISNNQSYYINPNTRQFTSNVKNTAIKDREVFNGSMQNLLNPIEDLVQVLKTPIKLVDSSSLNRLSNSVNIASDMRIAVNNGYILEVKQQGVEVSGGNDPYDTEAYMKAQKMAGSLSTLLRNACGNMHTVAYSQEEYARWTEGVSDVMGYLGIDYSFYR